MTTLVSKSIACAVSFMLLSASGLQAQQLAEPNLESVPTTETSSEIVSTEVEKKKKKKVKKQSRAEVLQQSFQTIASGQVEEVSLLIKERKINYYRTNKEGETALTLAIQNEDLEMVKVLEKRAVIDLKNAEGETPLILALKKGNPSIINVIAKRAKGSLKNKEGETPLYIAIQNDMGLAIINKLIQRGAKVDYRSKGITPLAQATLLNQPRTVAFLLKKGAKSDKPNEDGTIPLAIAISKGYDLIAGMLINSSETASADVLWKDPTGMPLMNIAAKRGNPAIVRLLLETGATLSQYDFEDNSALHIAAANGHSPLVNFLLQYDEMDIHKQNFSGASPIVLAAKGGHVDCYNTLSSRGAKANDMDFTGYAANEYLDMSKKGLDTDAINSKYGKVVTTD